MSRFNPWTRSAVAIACIATAGCEVHFSIRPLTAEGGKRTRRDEDAPDLIVPPVDSSVEPPLKIVPRRREWSTLPHTRNE